jgi:SAM-dependent methyltransferase
MLHLSRRSRAAQTTTRRARALYDRYRFGDFSYSQRRPALHPTLVSLLDSCTTDHTVCDIGCGAGYWMRFLAERGAVPKNKIVGVDLASENVRQLRSEGFPALVGDAGRLPLPSDCADFTVSSGVIHHTQDPRQSFAELVRITKAGGTIYLAVYNVFHPYSWLVHKLSAPLRWIYWNVSESVAGLLYPLLAPFAQPIFLLRTGRFAPSSDLRVHLMDQVFTPRAHLFSERRLRRWCAQEGVRIVAAGFVHGRLMRELVIRVERSS